MPRQYNSVWNTEKELDHVTASTNTCSKTSEKVNERDSDTEDSDHFS